jgi:hypothetical protein
VAAVPVASKTKLWVSSSFTDVRCGKGWKDNHDLILHTSLYCMWYRTYTSELYRQLSSVALNGLIWSGLLWYNLGSDLMENMYCCRFYLANIQEFHLRGYVFTEPLLSSWWFLDCD